MPTPHSLCCFQLLHFIQNSSHWSLPRVTAAQSHPLQLASKEHGSHVGNQCDEALLGVWSMLWCTVWNHTALRCQKKQTCPTSRGYGSRCPCGSSCTWVDVYASQFACTLERALRSAGPQR